MKHFLLLFGMLCVGKCLYSQTHMNVRYTYDNAGNRISRQILYTYNKKATGDTIYVNNSSSNPIEQINQSQNQSYAVVYPNPVKDVLQISLKGIDGNEMGTYTIIDLYGRTVLQTQSIETNVNIEVSQLPDGVYTLHFKLLNKTIVHRINKFRK